MPSPRNLFCAINGQVCLFYRAARLRLSEDNQTCLNCRSTSSLAVLAAKLQKIVEITKESCKKGTRKLRNVPQTILKGRIHPAILSFLWPHTSFCRQLKHHLYFYILMPTVCMFHSPKLCEEEQGRIHLAILVF